MEINALWDGKFSLARVKIEPFTSVTRSEPQFVSADSVPLECVPSQGRRPRAAGELKASRERRTAQRKRWAPRKR